MRLYYVLFFVSVLRFGAGALLLIYALFFRTGERRIVQTVLAALILIIPYRLYNFLYRTSP
jgi:hypothetical protein